MSKTFKIPPELAEKIRQTTAKVGAKYKDRAEQYDVYSAFVESQKKYFLEDISMILKTLQQLIADKNLSETTSVFARIKDPESAMNNDNDICQDELMKEILSNIKESDYTTELTDKENTKEKSFNGKALDDVFGITIITEKREEVEDVYKTLQEKFSIKKEKQLIKEGYYAKHLYFWNPDRKNEEAPLIECQLKTAKDHMQSYDHTLYKVECSIGKGLNQCSDNDKKLKVRLNEQGIEKVWSVVQKFYDNGKFNTLTNVPRMWEAKYNETTGQMELNHLRETQVLETVYHNLNTNSGKDK